MSRLDRLNFSPQEQELIEAVFRESLHIEMLLAWIKHYNEAIVSPTLFSLMLYNLTLSLEKVLDDGKRISTFADSLEIAFRNKSSNPNLK